MVRWNLDVVTDDVQDGARIDDEPGHRQTPIMCRVRRDPTRSRGPLDRTIRPVAPTIAHRRTPVLGYEWWAIELACERVGGDFSLCVKGFADRSTGSPTTTIEVGVVALVLNYSSCAATREDIVCDTEAHVRSVTMGCRCGGRFHGVTSHSAGGPLATALPRLAEFMLRQDVGRTGAVRSGRPSRVAWRRSWRGGAAGPHRGSTRSRRRCR